MLEVLSSEAGQPVVRWEGLSLASLRRPEREAQKWVEQVSKKVEACEHIIVLGLGCGYHIFELRQKYPNKNIYVLEACRELIDFCEKHFSMEMARVEVIRLDSICQLSSSARVQKAISQPYSVIEHTPSLQPKRSFYKEIAALLRGREPAVFRDFLSLRSSKKELFDEKRILQELGEEPSSCLLSIKDLERWLKPEQRWSKTGCFVQVLRELVK